MGAKSLLLLGLIVSALFVYLCIDSKKDALYAELFEKQKVVPETNITTAHKEIKTEIIKPKIIKKPKKDASFAYVSGEKIKIAGLFSQEDNESKIIIDIETLCKKSTCVKDIQFKRDIAPYKFDKDTLGLIEIARKEKIKDFALFVNKKNLNIEGSLHKKSQQLLFKPYFNSFLDANYTIEDNTNVVEPFTPAIEEKINLDPTPPKKEVPKVVVDKKERPKTTIIKEVIDVEAPRDIFVTPQHFTIQEAEEEINSILSANSITFEYSSSTITKSSKATLDDVIDILLGLDSIMIEVAGYTDSKGDMIYNKVLSQKRADAVRSYFIESGLRAKLIKSKGYGEKDPIASPEDIINRRVEIHIMEGE